MPVPFERLVQSSGSRRERYAKPSFYVHPHVGYTVYNLILLSEAFLVRISTLQRDIRAELTFDADNT